MKDLSRIHRIAKRKLCVVLLLAAMALLLLGNAAGVPITYVGFTVTDGQLGSWSFHNGRVFLTFDSDTSNVQYPVILNVPVAINAVGTARVTIVTNNRTVSATLSPNQIFVAVDYDDVLQGARGIGFGSFSPASPGGVEPAYPLGIEDGTIDWGDITEEGCGGCFASPALYSLDTSLAAATAFSGRAWSCVGFPASPNPCGTPLPLATDKGNFLLFQPYQDVFQSAFGGTVFGDPLGGGIFLALVGQQRELISRLLPRHAASSPLSFSEENPVTYTAFFLSDVTLGQQQYFGVPVFLRLHSDSSKVQTSPDGTRFVNRVGVADVSVVTANGIVTAFLAPGEVYVYLDIQKSAVGFGSAAGGVGYPLSLLGTSDFLGLTQNNLVLAVTDILRTPSDLQQFFSADTGNLITNLKNSSTLSGGAASCAGSFDPSVGTCANVAGSVALRTNLGNLYFYEPYYFTDTVVFLEPFSVNWGIFWIDAHSERED